MGWAMRHSCGGTAALLPGRPRPALRPRPPQPRHSRGRGRPAAAAPCTAAGPARAPRTGTAGCTWCTHKAPGRPPRPPPPSGGADTGGPREGNGEVPPGRRTERPLGPPSRSRRLGLGRGRAGAAGAALSPARRPPASPLCRRRRRQRHPARAPRPPRARARAAPAQPIAAPRQTCLRTPPPNRRPRRPRRRQSRRGRPALRRAVAPAPLRHWPSRGGSLRQRPASSALRPPRVPTRRPPARAPARRSPPSARPFRLAERLPRSFFIGYLSCHSILR